MTIQASIATVTISGITPMTQSRQHDEPKLEGESMNDYDIRTWRSKLTVDTRDGKKTIVIPVHGVHQCIAAAAKYSKRQIPGQGKATWTAKFTAGISLLDHPALNIDPDSVSAITISANADGVRGSGKRVPRRFPVIPAGWTTTFDVLILDPIITKDVFVEMMELAGIFVGLGQFRPQSGGTNGRFQVKSVEWADNRRWAA
jgi:hypothetical protein